MGKAGAGDVRRGAAKGAETPESVGEDWGGEERVLGAARAGDPKAVYSLHGPWAPRAVPEEFSRGFFPSRQSVSPMSSPRIYARETKNMWDSRTLIPAAYRPEGLGGAGHTTSPPEASLRAGGRGGGSTRLRTLVKLQD